MNFKKCAVLILLSFGLFGGTLFAESAAAKRLLELDKVLIEQKQAWFKYMEEISRDKIKLLETHHEQCADLAMKFTKMIDSENLNSPVAKENLFEKQFKEKLELHKKHCKDWKDLMHRAKEKAQKLEHKHKKQLEDKFELKPHSMNKKGDYMIAEELEEERGY